MLRAYYLKCIYSRKKCIEFKLKTKLFTIKIFYILVYTTFFNLHIYKKKNIYLLSLTNKFYLIIFNLNKNEKKKQILCINNNKMQVNRNINKPS